MHTQETIETFAFKLGIIYCKELSMSQNRIIYYLITQHRLDIKDLFLIIIEEKQRKKDILH